jgi:hypothetical protein
MTWNPLGRVLSILAHFCTLHLTIVVHLISVFFSMANDMHMLCEHIFVPMQVQQLRLGYQLILTPLNSFYDTFSNSLIDSNVSVK